jgi:hypothetical protein
MNGDFASQFVRWWDGPGLGAWGGWHLAIVAVLAWLGLVGLLLFLLTQVRYRIRPKSLQITIFGLPVRWVRLDNIRNLHTHQVRFAERWHNVLLPGSDRILVIEKRRGWIRSFVITPQQRYVFKAELDRAIRACLGLQSAPTAGTAEVLDRLQTPRPNA